MSAPRMIGKLAATVTLIAALAGVSAGAAAAAPRTGPLMSPNLYVFTVYGNGYGASLGSAELNAEAQIMSNYFGCGHNFYLVTSSQLSPESWFARMTGTCAGPIEIAQSPAA